MSFVIQNCIAWNEAERRKAERDAVDQNLFVPSSATRRVFEDGRAKMVRLSRDEYRDVRWADADRFDGNIHSLRARLSA